MKNIPRNTREAGDPNPAVWMSASGGKGGGGSL